MLPPAWFAFAALFAGRGSWVNGRTWPCCLHPVVVLSCWQRRHPDLIRYYPHEAVFDPDAVAEPGPLFWPHLVYSGVVMWGSLILMVAALLRASRVYRRVTTILIVSLVVPYGFNLLYNLDVGPFGRVDLTPFLLIVSCLVLVWGLFGSAALGIARWPAPGVETISEAGWLDPLRGWSTPTRGRAAAGPPPADAVAGPRRAAAEAAEAVRDAPVPATARPRPVRGAGRDQARMTHRYEPTVVAMPDGRARRSAG